MNISKVRLVYFSPTETTRKILEAVARGLGPCGVERFDLTPPSFEAPDLSGRKDALVLMGSPVYGGRIPAEAARRFRMIKGSSSPAVVLVVYGNREFEDSLRELTDIAAGLGLGPVACGAFLGEHSFSRDGMPIAAGRPDGMDLAKAEEFGASVMEKIRGTDRIEGMRPVPIPGNFPYKQWNPPSASPPVVDKEKCIECGKCVSVCPMGGEPPCILCSACLKACPVKARSWEGTPLAQSAKWLYENCGRRKEPQAFF